jgi:hypothetical protein
MRHEHIANAAVPESTVATKGQIHRLTGSGGWILGCLRTRSPGVAQKLSQNGFAVLNPEVRPSTPVSESGHVLSRAVG